MAVATICHLHWLWNQTKMVEHNLNSTTCTFALALGKSAVKTKIFTLFIICTEISEDIKFHSRTLPKNAATDSLAILHFTMSLLLAIYSYHKAIKTTKFWGNFRMQNLSNLLLPGKKWTTFLQKNICRKKWNSIFDVICDYLCLNYCCCF